MTSDLANNPRVSVILPVYNGAVYLREAIDSILSQTFPQFELLIVDDASTDASADIIASYADPRMHTLTNHTNLGLAASLNRGIDAARGEYIARMDADDISLPERLSVQVSFLDAHPDIIAAGSYARILGTNQLMRHPTDPAELKANLLFHTSLIHPTLMLRRSFLEAHHLRYDPAFLQTQDYELFTRMAALGKLSNIPRVLLRYRQHDRQASAEKVMNQIRFAQDILRRQLTALGLTATDTDLATLGAVKRYRFPADAEFLDTLAALLLRIERANVIACIYDAPALRRVLGEVWLETCIALSRRGVRVQSRFLHGAPRHWIRPSPRNLARALRLLVTRPRTI